MVFCASEKKKRKNSKSLRSRSGQKKEKNNKNKKEHEQTSAGVVHHARDTHVNEWVKEWGGAGGSDLMWHDSHSSRERKREFSKPLQPNLPSDWVCKPVSQSAIQSSLCPFTASDCRQCKGHRTTCPAPSTLSQPPPILCLCVALITIMTCVANVITSQCANTREGSRDVLGRMAAAGVHQAE